MATVPRRIFVVDGETTLDKAYEVLSTLTVGGYLLPENGNNP